MMRMVVRRERCDLVFTGGESPENRTCVSREKTGKALGAVKKICASGVSCVLALTENVSSTEEISTS